jgi:hypothetical protein
MIRDPSFGPTREWLASLRDKSRDASLSRRAEAQFKRKAGFGDDEQLCQYEALGVTPDFTSDGRQPMSTEEAAPPTEQMRERRDTDYVQMAQKRYAQGFHARLAELHPMKRNASGKELQQREPRWRFCEVDGRGEVDRTHATERCPGKVETNRMNAAGVLVNLGWPAHEQERWVAGYIHADAICAERGLAAARAADPTKHKRVKRETTAEPIEAFPEAVLTKPEAREYWSRQERIRHGQSGTLMPTSVDG